MQCNHAAFMKSAGKAMAGLPRRAFVMPVIALSAFALVSPKPAEALTYEIFLIATHSAPAPSTMAPFSIDTTSVYLLDDLNSSQGARRATQVDNFSFDIDSALTFNNGVSIDPTEPAASVNSYIDSEVATWDNVNISGTGPSSPDEQIDFGRNAPAIFNPAANGFTDLVIAELGGFNPFELGLCSDAVCGTYNRIFSGINSGLRNSLFDLPDFAINESDVESELDQTWLFRFSEPVFDYVRVLEFDNRNFFTNNRLQVDFIGTGGGVSSPSPVPLPTGLPLMASGLGFLAWRLRRKKS